MEPNITPISNIVLDNGFTLGGSSPVTGNADTDYRATFGQELGLTIHLLPDFYNLSLGVVTFLPFSQLIYADTGSLYQPEYVLYRSRTQRPQIEFGAGADFGQGFHFGAGLHFGFALSTNADSVLQQDNSKTSSMSFATTMKLRAAPYFGLLFLPDGSDAFSVGFVARLAMSSDDVASVSSHAKLGIINADFNFDSQSALQYDPYAVEIGTSFKTSSETRTYAQLDYQFWQLYHPPAMGVEQSANTPGAYVAPTIGPPILFRNIGIPKVGEELTLGNTRVRLGYAYRPGIVSDPPNGPGNTLDPPSHVLSAGVGFEFRHLFGLAIPSTLDMHFAYHFLVTQHVVKTPGDESGNASGSKVGSPGYDAGGNALGGGISFNLAI